MTTAAKAVINILRSNYFMLAWYKRHLIYNLKSKIEMLRTGPCHLNALRGKMRGLNPTFLELGRVTSLIKGHKVLNTMHKDLCIWSP